MEFESTKNNWIIIDREAGILAYEYSFAKEGTANAFTLRMKDGSLLVISPPCRVEEGVFADLEAFGGVGAVVASNGFHHLGLADWKERFPQARVFAPSMAHGRIRKKNAHAPQMEEFAKLQELLGEDVGVTEAPATKCGEMWAWASGAGGTVWFASDILSNMKELPKNPMINLLFRLTGTKTGFGVFHTALKFMVKDKKQVLAKLSAEMKANPPTMIIPAHGPFLHQANLAGETQAILSAAM